MQARVIDKQINSGSGMSLYNNKRAHNQAGSGTLVQQKDNLKRAVVGALFGAAVVMSTPALAMVTFDNLSPNTYNGGATLAENGFTMTVEDSPAGPGLAGAIVNPADINSCFLIACPTGATSQYYAGVDDGGIVFTRVDGVGFHLNSLDFAFVAPLSGAITGAVGKLNISGISQATGGTYSASIDFPQQMSGQYAFSNWVLSSRFSSVVLTQLSISACIYDTDGGCYRPAENLAQFAIDNVNVSAVPEPGTWAMLAIGLLGLAAAARRRRPV